MVNVCIDPTFSDEDRRRHLFAGDVIVYTHLPEVEAFAAFTRDLVRTAFDQQDPVSVHELRSREQLADTLIDFKPKFIHHPESMAHIRRITTALGASAAATYSDVPKLRTAFPSGSLNTGIAYAFQPHRDTWYAAPMHQINWWLPVWPAAAENVMEFFPRGFGNEIENNSGDYNYYVANAWRGDIKSFSGAKDTRVHPSPVIPLTADEPRLTLVPPVGGIMLFSGDQLHASIPNTTTVTRYSIDFRTVDAADLADRRGAPVVDVACRGTSLRDFHRLTDGAGFTEDEIAPYDTEGADGIKVFQPTT
jgi:hypothetical protein